MNAIMQNFDKIFNASLIYATFRSATPIIFAALCAAITQQANILNIGTEGIMLVGAFTAVAVSYFTGSWLLGIIAAMIAGAVIAMIMAVGHIRYNSEICAIGMGINLLALALTKFMVNAIFHSTGSFSSPDIKAIPRVSLGFLDNLPVVGDLFNNWCVTEWFAIVLIILLQFFFYKTVWGLRLRAVGQFPEAAKTAGIKVNAIKYQAMLLSGLIGGLAGAHLSLGYSTQFIENMTNNRVHGRCSHVFRWCEPGSDHTGLSALWIFRFRRCPSSGIWHSIPVRSDDAVYRDHRGTGNFHDCEDFSQQEERIFPACGKLMMKKDKTL